MPQDTMPALSGLDRFEQLENLLGARRLDGSPEAAMTFEAFEVELAQVMRRFEHELKAADLARDDVDAETLMGNGQRWRQCLTTQPKTSLSASGPITVRRNLYRPAGGGKRICPLERNAGIIGGLHTPVVARQVASLRGHLTSEETSQVLGARGIEGPSSRTCDRLPKRLREAWEAHRVQWECASGAGRGGGRDGGRGGLARWGDGAGQRRSARSQGHTGGGQGRGLVACPQRSRWGPRGGMWHRDAR